MAIDPPTTSPATEDAPVATQHTDVVHKVEILISDLLRTGVVTSLLIVLAGTVLSFVHHPSYVDNRRDLDHLARPGAAFPHTLRDVANGVLNGRGQAIVMAGLILLIATPVARVAVSIFAFVYQKDRVFVIITSVVLTLLLLSFVLGKAEG